MSNVLGTNPWYLDTTTGSTPITSNAVKILHFEFVGYSLSTDTCVLQDAHNKVVWKAHGASDLEEVRSYKVGWIDGLTLITITSGAVLVFFE